MDINDLDEKTVRNLKEMITMMFFELEGFRAGMTLENSSELSVVNNIKILINQYPFLKEYAASKGFYL